MKYPKYLVATIPVLVLFLAVSCKKGPMPNLGTIKIATVTKTESGGSRYYYHISYDAYNNVDSIGIIGGGNDTGYFDYLTFNYVGSSFVKKDYQNGSVFVDANTDGQIIEVQTLDTLIMTYNGSELTELEYKLPIPGGTSCVLDSNIYLWNDGDLTGYKYDTGVVDSYYYDLTRSGQIGDAMNIDLFLQYGRSYFSTVHLPDELSYRGVWIEEDLYTFDSQGRINQLMKVINSGSGSPNDTTTYLYTYY